MRSPSLPLRPLIPVLLAFLALVCAAAGQPITVQPANATGTYAIGDTVSWNIALSAGASASGLTYSIKSGGLTLVDSGGLTLQNGKATLSARSTKPDWLLLQIDGKDGTGASFTAYGGALVSPEKITVSAPPPADFDAFWQARLDELAQVPMNAVVTPKSSGVAGVDYATIEMDNIRNTHIQGQLARPTAGTKFPALLIVQWAGVYSLDPSWVTWRAQQGWLTLNIQAHDIQPVGPASYYTDLSNGALSNYPAQGNEDPNTSYFLRMYLACYRAVEYLASRPDWDGKVLVVTGASQGGLQTLLTASINPRVTAAVADVPAGCDQTGPDVGRSPGWPQWYYQTWGGRDAAKVKSTSRYYDICNFVSRIRCPVLIGTGMIDTVVPPIGVFAAFNQIRSPREIVAMPLASHGEHHDVYNARAEAVLALLRSGASPGLASDADGTLRWKKSVASAPAAGSTCASPAQAADGSIVTAVLGASPGIVACHAKSGTLRWTYAAPDAVSGPPACVPDGGIVFGCANGAVVELTGSGTLRWSASLASPISGSPAVGPEGTVFVSTTGGTVASFKADGASRWKVSVPGGTPTSPVLLPDGGVCVGTASGILHELNADGTPRWSFTAGGAIAGSPSLAANGSVYFGAGDKQLFCVSSDGSLKWSLATGGAIVATPVLAADGTVYTGSADGRLHAVGGDGKERWVYPAADAPALQAIVSSAAVRADGSVVFTTKDGLAICLDPSGAQRWATLLGAPTGASPLVADDGGVFAGTDDASLCALTGTEAPLLADWAQARRDPGHQAWQPMGRAPSGGGHLTALSVRAEPGTGDGELVAGYIVGGSGQRSVLLRAVGPTLKDFGVDGFMADPYLTLFSGTTPIATNDDWSNQGNADLVASTAQTLGDFALPQGSKDAALLTDLGSGLYTVYPLGAARATGVTLLELYEAGGTGDSTFTGLSARNQVGTGSRILVAGFVISGGPRSVVIQGIGPSLSKYLKTVLTDPVIRLYRDTQLIAENDDWGESTDPVLLSNAAKTAYAQTLDAGSRDAGLVVTLPPGLYSVELRGKGGLTGPGMIEVYALP